MTSAASYGAPVPSKFWDRKTDAKGALMGSSSWPCQKPPWGHLTAVNANTGEFAWRIVFGVTDELPEGKKNTGRINGGGSIATAGGLVFIGATNDKRFHAFDSKTGKLLWEVKLEYDAIATPITYSRENREAIRRDHCLGRAGNHRSESGEQRTDLRVRAAVTISASPWPPVAPL